MLYDQTSETLTCLAESAGHTLLWNGREIACRLYRDGVTDTLCFVLDYVGEETEPLATNHFRVYYNSTPYGFDTAAGFSSPVCTLSHVAGCEAVRLRLESTEDTFTMDGRARREITYPFAWYDSLPCLTWNAVLYAQYANRITWQVTAPAGRVAYPTHGALYVRRAGETRFTLRTETKLSPEVQGWIIRLEEEDMGAAYYFRVTYCTAEAADGTQLTRNRADTPETLVTRNGSIPYPPEVTHSAVMRGGKVRVRWSAPEDPLYTLAVYDLYRAVAAETDASPEWGLLYSGKAVQFLDVPPEEGYIRYRVRGRTADGVNTVWVDTGWLRQNTSNLYVGKNGIPVPAASIRIGGDSALAMGYVGGI